MSEILALETRYAKPVEPSKKLTHITTWDTLQAIRQTFQPGSDLPTVLAIRQSRSNSNPTGVNVSCNGGPFIYTFAAPAEAFDSTQAGRLAIEGIQVKAKGAPLALLEFDASIRPGQQEPIPRFLPLTIPTARRIISLLSESDMGRFILSVFNETLEKVTKDSSEALRTKREKKRMFRAIATTIAYSYGLSNFALYGPRIAKHLFMSEATNFNKAGHGFITGQMPADALRDMEGAIRHANRVIQALEGTLETTPRHTIPLPEVYDALGEFYDPGYYGLNHTSLELFLDLDFTSFYWMEAQMRAQNQLEPNQIDAINLLFHSLYHFLLLENIFQRHVGSNNQKAQFFKTYEPNAGNENFCIISPGKDTTFPASVYRLDDRLKHVENGRFALRHDYAVPLSSATTGFDQLGHSARLRELQQALADHGLLMQNRRV